MKKLILIALITLMFSTSAMALSWTPGQMMSVINPPPVPTTGDQLCSPFSIKDTHCSGDIKVYQQCIQEISGSFWQQRTENCKLHGTDWYCINNACQKSSAPPPQDFCSTGFGSWVCQNPFIFFMAVILVIAIIWKRKK